MSDEKRRVLEMLESGKISQEDALRLLEALGESKDAAAPSQPEQSQEAPGPVPEEPATPQAGEKTEAPPQPQQKSGVDNSFSQAMEEVRSEVGAAMREAGQALSEAADEAMAAMGGGEKKPAGKAVPKLTLWPETPLGDPLKEPVPPPEPAGEPRQTAHTQPDVPRTVPEHTPFQPMSVEGAPYNYPGVAEEIESVDIDWISGPVEVRSWDGDVVNVTEYAKRPLDYGQQLEITVTEGNMRIRWTRERAFWKGILLSKHLVVEIPRRMQLEKLKVKNVSGSVSAAELSSEDVSLVSTSGRVEALGVTAENLKMNSVSGAIRVEAVSAEDVDLNTTSGRTEVGGLAAEKAKLNTVSGSLRVFGNAEKFTLNSVSGSIELRVGECPEKAELKSVSGRVSLIVPENDGFTVKYNSMSGNFHSEFPLAGNLGQKSGKAAYASGGAEFSLNTMSGGMEIRKG